MQKSQEKLTFIQSILFVNIIRFLLCRVAGNWGGKEKVNKKYSWDDKTSQ